MNWLKRILRMKPKPCHVAYEDASADVRVFQGADKCAVCGVWHLTKPKWSNRHVKNVFGN